jgi:biopolymer transport protein TolR
MSEINVTPLVDVMLVLLIIFMVTAPMMQEGISVELPQASGAPWPKTAGGRSRYSRFGQGNIFVNEVAVQEDKLPETILEAIKERPSREVFLRADKAVSYGTVVRIMAALKKAGIANLGIITTPQEESAPVK